jgi:trypsin
MKRALVAVATATFLFAAQGCSDPATSNLLESIGSQPAPIVGGIADPNHRYVVSIGGCTGTVISKHTVLTAGHCFGSVSSTVGFGPTVSGATTVQVAGKVRDPMYADICDQDATYDLTVVKLAEPAPSQAAPLLRATLDNSAKYVGPSWVWVGYGRTGSSGGTGTKRVTTFPIDLIGPATGRGSLCEIPETLIYATSHGRMTCNGDSGGPSFWVGGGVEYLAGVTSSGDDACMLDGTQQRSDQPYLDHFIQAQIDANEGNDPCRSNGVCDETCNTGGQLGDPDCAFRHCGADGICAEACVAPRDPDCAPLDSTNCGDNGVCDLTCPTDPDCTRDCAAESNCIPNCPTPDPDCAGQDGGAPEGGSTDGGVRDGSSTDAVSSDAGGADATTTDATTTDATTTPPDAPPPDAPTPDAGRSDGATTDAGARDTAVADRAATDGGGATDTSTLDASTRDSGAPEAGSTVDGGAGGGPGGPNTGPTTGDSGCSCRSAASSRTSGGRGWWLALAIAVSALRRRTGLRR